MVGALGICLGLLGTPFRLFQEFITYAAGLKLRLAVEEFGLVT